MAPVRYYQMTDEDLETQADFVKTRVLASLVKEGLLEREIADDWCGMHTLIKRKKSFFRTISDNWKKKKTEENVSYWIVVKGVELE